MRAIRLHGPADLRLEIVPDPPAPSPGQVLIRSKAVGICGSDLHVYTDARIGTTPLDGPLVLGHEFAGIVEAIGEGATDAFHKPLRVGSRVAVDPAQPCGRCEFCEKGHPNLCLKLPFLGMSPYDGALQDLLLVPGGTVFPLPDDADFGHGSLLETLGVALHAVDLAHIRVGDSAAILGAGPIGLSILQVARLAGASPVFVVDEHPWRLKLAEKLGAVPVDFSKGDPAAQVIQMTGGRGVDVAIEAAWADVSVQQAVDMARNGGGVVVVGISSGDMLTFRHSIARRKGLTMRLARRMKHVYPRAIELFKRNAVDLEAMVSHRMPLEKTAEAFAMNARYEAGVVKMIIEL